MSQFSETIRENTKPRERRVSTGSDYIRLTPEHTTVIRVLDDVPVVSWSHYVPKKHAAFPTANAGKGMSFICPGRDVCPICEWNKAQYEKEEKPKNTLNSRKIFTFNVLDRTPVVTCAECGMEHYESKDSGFPEECANPDCNASLVDVKHAPRDKVQIFQKGVMIMKQLMAFESEFGDINSYDIKLDTMGQADQTSTICVPKPPQAIHMDKILGEDWKEKLYDVKNMVKPMEVDSITRILNGEDYYSVFKKQ